MKRAMWLAVTMIVGWRVSAEPTFPEVFLGSGCRVGEVTDRSAIVHVRLTATEGQDEEGLIPGQHGLARLRYGIGPEMRESRTTEWLFARDDYDNSVQFILTDLRPATRWFYEVEYRSDARSQLKVSAPFSFVTAPPANQRAAVHFQVTTGQDVRGADTYQVMAASRPDFLVSTGDNVYYDGFGARNIAQAFQAYQRIYGAPQLKDYFRHIAGYFEKDDHDYRFNDSDPYMAGKWVSGSKARKPGAVFAKVEGKRGLDVNWLSHEDGIRVFKRVWPMSEKTYRTFRWGRGVQIWLLEGRDFRSPNNMPDGPQKTIWGQMQKRWLYETLLASDADWRIVISPTPIIGPDRTTKRDNHANPNGFWTEGQAFLDWIKEHDLNNVVLVCGDRHWQYHTIDRRNGRSIHEFSCGPTCDQHTQAVPPPFEGVERPYARSIGGFLDVRYQPSGELTLTFYHQDGEKTHQYTFH